MKSRDNTALLLIESDAMVRETLNEQLNLGEEFSCVAVSTAAEGLATAAEAAFDCLLISTTLLDLDFATMGAQLRQDGIKAPIIALASRDAELSGEPNLMADYVIKPFRLNLLIPRIRAQVRSATLADNEEIQIGPYVLRQGSLYETNGDKVLRLTEKEVDILKFFGRAKGDVVTRDALLAGVWGYNGEVNTHTLETHIYRLRQKIEPDPIEATLILTAPGGYRLGSAEAWSDGPPL